MMTKMFHYITVTALTTTVAKTVKVQKCSSEEIKLIKKIAATK